MGLFVSLEDGGAGEGLAAESAREGPLAGVDPGVVLHVVAQFERLSAEVAAKRPLARVERQMGHQRRQFAEDFAAEFAHAVTGHGHPMHIQRRRSTEGIDPERSVHERGEGGHWAAGEGRVCQTQQG